MKSAAAISRQLQSNRQKVHKQPAKKVSKINAIAHHHGGTSTTAGSPSSNIPVPHGHLPHRLRPPGPFRDSMGLQAMRPRKKGFTMTALKGKVTVKCIWAACKAMSIGILFIAIGASLMAVGFYAEPLSIKGEKIVNGTVVIIRNRSKFFHLSNMSYVGPIVMGIGGFVILAACVMTFESRDAVAKIAPIKHKKKIVDASKPNGVSDNIIECPPAIDFSKAFANLNRAALTSAFIQFSGTIKDKPDGKTSPKTKNPDDKTNLLTRKSPSEPVLGRPCYLCQDPDKDSNHCTNCHRFSDSLPCELCKKVTVIRRSFSIDNHCLEGGSRAFSLRGLLPAHNGANSTKGKKSSNSEEFPLLDGIVPMAEQEDDEDIPLKSSMRQKTPSEDSVPMDVMLADCSITVKVTVEPHGESVTRVPTARSVKSSSVSRPRTIGDKYRKVNWNNGSVVARKCSPGGESVDFSDDNTESTTDYCEQWGGHRMTRTQPFGDGHTPYPIIRQNSIQPNIHYKLTRHK